MISPKKSFQENSLSKDWNSVVNSARFHTACTAALAQMELNMSCPPDMASAAAGHWQMQGAKLYLRTLMELANDPVIPPAPRSKNLTQ